MRSTGRYAAACVVAFGLISPLSASIHVSGDGDTLCAGPPAGPAGCLVSVGLKAAALDGVAKAAPPAAGARDARGLRQAGAQGRVSDIAALFFADRSAARSGDGAASLLFWVFGSGLLGFGFVARRRKPSLDGA